jgi:predicted nucleotide-binding protein (sugar kinase/HSP70/actin superfamily)
MKVGLPNELLHLEGVLDFKKRIDQRIQHIQWVHTPSGKNPQPLFLEADMCYPFKKIVRTSLALLPDIDTLLLPRIVNLDDCLMCPNFRALPDIVAINKERLGEEAEVNIVTPLMESCRKDQLDFQADAAVRELQRGSGHHLALAPSLEKADAIAPENRDISRSIALIGHPYLVNDSTLNNGVAEIVKACGYDIVLSQEIPFNVLDQLARSRDYYAKKMYWRPGRESLGGFLYFTEVNRPAGIIQLIAFNCGVDALLRIELMSLKNKMEKAIPFMALVCDEHTQRDHVVTRIEAFIDIIHGIKIS